jgi:soluble lytic murein transglycosylase-like protein
VRSIPLFVWLCAAGLAAAQAPDPYAAARAAQEAAANRQRAAVRGTTGTAAAESSFFTVPFATPAPMATPRPDSEESQETAAAGCEPVQPEELEDLISSAADREGLTPDLLRAMIGKESSFRPCAESRKGAQGLMQLMPATQADLGVTNPFSPKQNIDAGARLMRRLLDRYGGDLRLALGAYNAGPGQVDAAGGLPDIPETINYVSDLVRKLIRK